MIVRDNWHRDGASGPEARFRSLRAGGGIDHPSLRRDRSRTDHLQEAGRIVRREHSSEERTREGFGLHVHPAAASDGNRPRWRGRRSARGTSLSRPPARLVAGARLGCLSRGRGRNRQGLAALPIAADDVAGAARPTPRLPDRLAGSGEQVLESGRHRLRRSGGPGPSGNRSRQPGGPARGGLDRVRRCSTGGPGRRGRARERTEGPRATVRSPFDPSARLPRTVPKRPHRAG